MVEAMAKPPSQPQPEERAFGDSEEKTREKGRSGREVCSEGLRHSLRRTLDLALKAP